MTSGSRKGLFDFLAQRLTAVVLLAYVVYIGGVLVLKPDITHLQWSALFDSVYLNIFTTFAVASVVVHTWIGLWTVGTDYLRPSKLGSGANWIRIFYQTLILIALVGWFIWALVVIWQIG